MCGGREGSHSMPTGRAPDADDDVGLSRLVSASTAVWESSRAAAMPPGAGSSSAQPRQACADEDEVMEADVQASDPFDEATSSAGK